jgi:YbgC/YbaW family acyl-CoA thioester hydrolase
MVERLRELGSECYTRAAVKRIAVEDGAVTGVELESGEFVSASIVVSNANPYHTFFDLLAEEDVSQIFRYRLKQMTPSLSAYALYLGLDCAPSEIGIPIENYFYNHQMDCRESYDRIMARDIDHTDWCLANYENVDTSMYPKNKGIVSLVELTPAGNWLDLDKDAYAEKKDQTLEQLMRKYAKRFPELPDHIAVKEFGTPYTMARYSRNYQGAVYGFAQTLEQSNSRRLRNRSPIDGLYLTGSWTWAGGGYEGAMMAGVQTALAIQQQVGAPRPVSPIRLNGAQEKSFPSRSVDANTKREAQLGETEKPVFKEGNSFNDAEHFKFRKKVVVYGDDLNSKGFADVSAFLRYIDRGRVEAIEEICGEDKKSWIRQYVINVYTININCFGTPGFGERLEVLTGIRKTTTHRAAFDQRIFNAKTKELVLDAQVEVLFLNKDMELVPVPDEIPDNHYDGSKFKTGNRALVPFTDETSFPFRSDFRVYYEDTDAQGITYHVSYMRYCERALFELARSVWPEVTGKSWMAKHRVGVTAANIRYLKSSTLGDYLEVRTGLMEITPFRVVFGQRIVQRQTGEVLADVTTVCQFRDKNDKPVPIPPEALDAGLASLPNGRTQGGDL